MRKPSPLDPLLSKVVQDILAATLFEPQRWWYLSDLAGYVRRRPSTLQNPLSALVKSGILERREDGNRVYFRPDPNCPFLPELRGLILKTVGLVDVLRTLLSPYQGRIDFAFVYGSMARGEEQSSSDIDLIIIGAATRFDLAGALKNAGEHFGRPVNAMVYKPEEFAKKLEADNHFLQAVLDREKLFVVGTEHDLERTVTAKAGGGRGRNQAGA